MTDGDPLGIVGRTIDGFEIVAFVARGAFSRVYEAIDKNQKQRVALKIHCAESAVRPEVLTRFRREAGVVVQLRHPNIARVISSGEILGLPCIIMEFIEGESLADKIARGPVTEQAALAIGIGMAEALDYAHTQAGVIHRDVKPSNIRLDVSGRPLLTDFGVVKISGDARPKGEDTKVGEFVGT